MQRFYGSWMARFGTLFFSLYGLGSACFFFGLVPPWMRPRGASVSLLAATIPIGICFFLFGLLCLWGLVESFTVYTLDDEKIVKRAIYGTSELAWKYVTDIKVGGKQSIAIVLTDDAGRRMRLIPSLIRDEKGLRATIEEHLKPLREKQTQALRWQEKVYRPGRTIGYMLFALVALAGLSGFAVLSASHGNNSPSLQLAGALTFLVPIIAGALLALYFFTWTITISPGVIASSSLFFRKAIPFRQIEAVMVRDMPVKNGTINETTVQGAG